ncbi:SDR family NAD(P)-dependent oxidoreductase [Mesorhizobium sp. NBSH29]|uniref:SDR family NAD(P)-dependent oxidoreductase n=1 Tax=Mesorhizobium sp. NBSH29 TaxID=2654249 RepID=UPI0018968200|nr:SDR family NAD(P)-dependent oxidoreductase [Mesorhizobium sp. NBSH29]QPC87260.1 SDR family NAD(P)-dependent oxidoreductase [Mesorhizobium sp. NBSH29]
MSKSMEQPGTAWVTGAGTGIGRAVALKLARTGWRVAASARTKADLDALSAEAGGNIVPVPLDVRDAEAVDTGFAEMEKTLGSVDLVVLCAGIYRRDTARTLDPKEFEATVTTNLVGTANCLAAVMPAMMARKAGRIGVVGSVVGYVGLPGASAYGATKAALINLCQSLYPELMANGVQLSLISPGFVETPLTDKNDFPMPFMISAEEAANHIVKGLGSARFDIAFPWKMVVAMRLLAALPSRLLFAVTNRVLWK